MDVFDFIKSDELESLPDDPQLAFTRFVEIAEPRLIARLSDIDERDNERWTLIRDAEHGFQNVVLSAAKKFQIEPLGSEEVPFVRDYDENTYRQFRADLSHCLTQILLTHAERDRSMSIPLLQRTRQSLFSYVHYLREAIDAADLPDWKRKRLHKSLNDLESALTRGRFRINVAFTTIMALIAATSQLGPAYDTVVRLTNAIMKELGEAKELDKEQHQISMEAPAALMPPRSKHPKKTKAELFDRREMDEEIPF